MTLKVRPTALPTVAVAALSLTLAACSSSSTPGTSTSTGTSAAANAWSKAYDGTQLNVIGEATANTAIIEKLLPDFEAKTGIHVSIEQAP